MTQSGFELGAEPKSLNLFLNAHADHVSTIQREGVNPWDPGTEVYLELTMADKSVERIDAVIDGRSATFTIDEVDVDAIIARRPRAARLFYRLGDARLLWGLGEVTVTT